MERLKFKELKALSKSLGLKGYSKLNKSDLAKLVMDHLNSRPKPTPHPRHTPLPRPTPSPHPRPPKATRPPPPPPARPTPVPRSTPPLQTQSVRFRPDRPRQPKLLRRLEGISTPTAS